jgi:hypothetical protein
MTRILSRVLSGKSRVAALLLAAALLNLSSVAPRAATTFAKHTGEITVANGIVVDGSPALRGQTLFSGSRLAFAGKSISLLSLDNLGRVELSEGAALSLDFDDAGLGGALEVGRLRVYAPRGVAANFSTADASVRSDARDAVSFTLRASAEGYTEVSVQSGALEVRANGVARLLKAGESFATAPGPQPQQNLSGRKRAGIIVAIASAVALVAVVLTERGSEEPLDFGGCVIILSPGAGSPCS